jgi:hypothetical protein
MSIKPKFTAKDFLDQKYNIAGLTENQTVLAKFPELKKYPEFNEKNPAFNGLKIGVDKIFRYVILMYSDNVIHRLIPEFAHRKREAAIMAGIDMNENGKFHGQVEKMMRCEYDSVNDIAVRVMFLNRNTAFTLFCAYNDALFIQVNALNSPKSDKEKTKDVIANIEKLKELISKLEIELTNEDTNANLLDRLYSFVEGINLGIRPEEIALAKKQGKLKEVLNVPE